ncbi:uncharacterized protein [Miscanthus floridulus]|uniref:uncharacterized protein n=1 Tax=Miscanthus floridulus TaxID=154761 RepID=UPI00345853BA
MDPNETDDWLHRNDSLYANDILISNRLSGDDDEVITARSIVNQEMQSQCTDASRKRELTNEQVMADRTKYLIRYFLLLLAVNQYISYNLQDLETIVSKQTVEFGTKLANHGIHVDECIRKLRHRLEEFKAGVMVDVVFLKEECLERAAVGQEGTEVLEEKNLKFQDDLIGKVQQTQYNVVKTTAIAAVVLGAVVFVVLHVKRGG